MIAGIETENGSCDLDQATFSGGLSSVGFFKFWEISDNISETVQDRDIWLQWKTNRIRNSYVDCQMAPFPMTLNDLEIHFCCMKPFCNSHTSENVTCIVYDMFTDESERACGL